MPIGGRIIGGGGGGGGGASSSWTVRKEFDFSGVSGANQHDFKTGSKDYDGVEYSAGDTANATLIKTVSGSGLELSPVTTTDIRWYTTGTMNAPRVAVQIQGGAKPLYAGLGATQAFAFQAIIEPATELAANYDEYGILLTNAATTYYCTSNRHYDSSAFSAGSPPIGNYLMRRVTGASPNPAAIAGAAESSAHKFFELVWYPGGTVIAASSADTNFVEPLSATTFQKFVTTNPGTTSTASSVAFRNSELWAMFYIANYGSSTAFKAVVKKFRLLTLE